MIPRAVQNLDLISISDLLLALLLIGKDSSHSVCQHMHGCITQGNCSLCHGDEAYHQKDVSAQRVYALIIVIVNEKRCCDDLASVVERLGNMH